MAKRSKALERLRMECIPEFILVVFLISIIPVIIVMRLSSYLEMKNLIKPKIKSMGYEFKDVKRFCDLIGSNLPDFVESKGLQRQYELFNNGESNIFMSMAKFNKKKNDEQQFINQ